MKSNINCNDNFTDYNYAITNIAIHCRGEKSCFITDIIINNFNNSNDNNSVMLSCEGALSCTQIPHFVALNDYNNYTDWQAEWEYLNYTDMNTTLNGINYNMNNYSCNGICSLEMRFGGSYQSISTLQNEASGLNVINNKNNNKKLNVFCTAAYGCQNALITNGHNIYCLGDGSCYQTSIINTHGKIWVGGKVAVGGGSINNVNQDMYILSNGGCNHCQISNVLGIASEHLQ